VDSPSPKTAEIRITGSAWCITAVKTLTIYKFEYSNLQIIRDREAEIIYQSEPEPSRIRGVTISHDWSMVCYGCEDSTLKVCIT
jgi:hypothetical protein